MKIIKYLITLSILFVITSCMNNSEPLTKNYEHFNEQSVKFIESKLIFVPENPTYIPINITNETASLESYDSKDGKFKEVVFHYRNTEKNQLYNLIITFEETRKIYNEDNIALGKESLNLNNNIKGYYEEDGTAQTLWWIKNDLTYRFVYFLYQGQSKIDKQELIASANSMKN
ncbi:hypothetical protein BVG16_22495 [Paenibacillus selenitireducens]|uniref:DUF4367 domain-containing protein n=1 Tax=Paenibacillus selenitireducens TaxID=1324314 RepID=A0A1T2X690_9BACL|nr:hypothetical protein [Paenibacillus selenitireducens]OPA75360.1 hypothetical protein BVG16_22495 [Paenibacillus selenitireducens]